MHVLELVNPADGKPYTVKLSNNSEIQPLFMSVTSNETEYNPWLPNVCVGCGKKDAVLSPKFHK